MAWSESPGCVSHEGGMACRILTLLIVTILFFTTIRQNDGRQVPLPTITIVPRVHLLGNLGPAAAGVAIEDVTMSSGTGHLQQGHGISFADYDCDGDLDLFVEAGGGVPGDKSFNLLFQNPGHGNHWLKIKLVGSKSNRAALGAQIKAVVKGADGTSVRSTEPSATTAALAATALSSRSACWTQRVSLNFTFHGRQAKQRRRSVTLPPIRRSRSRKGSSPSSRFPNQSAITAKRTCWWTDRLLSI